MVGIRLGAALALACAGAAAQRREATIGAARSDGLRVEGVLGTLAEEAVEAAMSTRRAAVDRCYRDGVGRFWYLGGSLEVKVRVRGDGTVARAEAVHPLGNYQVERCIVDVVRGMSFGRPRGGAEAEFTYSWHFLGRASLLPWGQRDVERQIEKRRGEIAACGKRGAPPGLRVAFFVGPGGKVTSVGVGADGPLDDEYARCVAGRIAGWRFEDPLGRMARATYQF